MASSATIIDAQGTKFRIDGTEVGGVKGFSGLGSGQAAERDRTTFEDVSFKRFGVGLQDGGSVSIEVNVRTADAGQRLVWQAYEDRDSHDYELELDNGETFEFSGFIKQFEITGGTDADVGGTIQVRVDGPVTGFPAPV